MPGVVQLQATRVVGRWPVVAATLGCWSGAWESPCTIPANVMDRYLTAPCPRAGWFGDAACSRTGDSLAGSIAGQSWGEPDQRPPQESAIHMPFRRAARRVLDPVVEFLRIEAVGGGVLLAATIAALALANSPLADAYQRFWQRELTVGGLTWDLRHWVNDGLMTVFFLVIGLEVKRELTVGRLRDPRRASLPILAAVAGALVPALVFLAFNPSGPEARGWAIPHGHRPRVRGWGAGPARFWGPGRRQGVPAHLGRGG